VADRWPVGPGKPIHRSRSVGPRTKGGVDQIERERGRSWCCIGGPAGFA